MTQNARGGCSTNGYVATGLTCTCFLDADVAPASTHPAVQTHRRHGHVNVLCSPMVAMSSLPCAGPLPARDRAAGHYADHCRQQRHRGTRCYAVVVCPLPSILCKGWGPRALRQAGVSRRIRQMGQLWWVYGARVRAYRLCLAQPFKYSEHSDGLSLEVLYREFFVSLS